MNQFLLLGMPGGAEWIIILVVLLLLFGGSKLPQLAKALGQSKRAFKEGMSEADEEERIEREREDAGKRASLSQMSDEELVAEARRRQAIRGGDAATRIEDERMLDQSTKTK
ncbi:MAG TPA: twin-arginine translocase TatA/TatE family subunit [Pyrinomonadaceae bacterium]|nr:twin-arginine translocase TatA/TatE family subunit [Pyrinomonadaceae bacterium]